MSSAAVDSLIRTWIHPYYEAHGSGRPLVLPTAGSGLARCSGRSPRTLDTNHEVIAVDLQGNGRTAGRATGNPILVDQHS